MDSVLKKWTTFNLRDLPYIDINFFGSSIEKIGEDGEKKMVNCEKKAYKNFKKLLKLLGVDDNLEITIFINTIYEDPESDGYVIDYDYKDFVTNIKIVGEFNKNGATFLKGIVKMDEVYYLMKRYFTEGINDQLRLLFYFEEKNVYLQVIDELFGILVKDKNTKKNTYELRNIFLKLQEIDEAIINKYWRASMERYLNI